MAENVAVVNEIPNHRPAEAFGSEAIERIAKLIDPSAGGFNGEAASPPRRRTELYRRTIPETP
jgi:hypothetical protein